MHSSTAGCINGSSQYLGIYKDLNEMGEYQCTRFIYIFSRDLRVSWQYSLSDKLAWKANDSKWKPWNKLIGILVNMLINIILVNKNMPISDTHPKHMDDNCIALFAKICLLTYVNY